MYMYIHLHLYIVHLASFLGSWEGGEVRTYICTRVHVNHISLACTSTYTSILIILFYDLYIHKLYMYMHIYLQLGMKNVTKQITMAGVRCLTVHAQYTLILSC